MIIAIALAAATLANGDPRAQADDDAAAKPLARLYEFSDVRARLDHPNLRVLDARPREAYEKGHIPGAVWVDEGAARTLAGKPGGLNDGMAWAVWLEPLSIGPDSEVVVYDGERQLSAARVWWLLSYLGAPRVGLLNGNFPL